MDPDGISSLYLMGKWTDSSFPENSYTQGVSLSGTFSDDHTFIGSFHQILGENTSKDTYNAEWKISGIQYSPEEAKNGNMYIDVYKRQALPPYHSRFLHPLLSYTR